jgi:hypothetical protein
MSDGYNTPNRPGEETTVRRQIIPPATARTMSD